MTPLLSQHPTGLATQTQKIKGVEYKKRIIDIHVNGILPLFTGKTVKTLNGSAEIIFPPEYGNFV